MDIIYRCKKCGKEMFAERNVCENRQACNDELDAIGKSLLFPHFEEHYPGEEGMMIIEPLVGKNFDFDDYSFIADNFGISVLYPLVVCRTNWASGKMGNIGFAI